MDKANTKTKKSLFRGVLDGFRSSVATAGGGGSLAQRLDAIGIEETIGSEHFQVTKTVRHGFPFEPTALAYDPVQNLLAVGTRSGSIRIFGQPGVDCHMKHDTEVAVTQLMFLVNEGALVSACTDDQLHLWSLRQKKPEIVHSLKFQRERITYCHLPFQSRWMYVGTDRGNVHVINLESFVLSGYIINWNKTIELLRKTHPGPVVHLSDNQMDTNKLLIGYESGMLALWDLKNRIAECRYSCTESLLSACWHHEGKQFICSHGDGSLTTWNVKSPERPQSAMMPHAKLRDGKPEPCRPITKVELRTNRNSEPYIIFSGGMPFVAGEKSSKTSTVTIMHGTNTTVLELEHGVIDFITICSTPWNNDFQDPFATAVLLQSDFVMVDLASANYPCFENPYPMDLHESQVTACLYFADCPPDLIPAFYSVGCKQKKSGYSEKEWPIKGGSWGSPTCSYPEIIVTGHADGSLKFWDASAAMLQVLYKMKTVKLFDESRSQFLSNSNIASPFAIQLIHLCVESRLLCIAGFSHVALFSFSRQESQIECAVIEISIVYEVFDGAADSPEIEFSTGPAKTAEKERGLNYVQGGGAQQTQCSNEKEGPQTSLKLKTGPRKWSTGYQPELCCLLTYIDNEPPPPITSLSLNSKYGLLAFGNDCGLAIIDIVQKSCVISIGSPDLYGSLDPYSRMSRSPKQKTYPQGFEGGAPQGSVSEDFKAPVVDQPPAVDALPSISSWEVVEACPEEDQCLGYAACKPMSGGGSLLAEECEIGCDALEVFDVGADSAVSETEGNDAVSGTDDGNCETTEATSSGSKMNWMRKFSHNKLRKFNLQKNSQRHSSVPDSSTITKAPSTAAVHFSLHFPKTSPPSTEKHLLPPTENQLQISPDHITGETSPNSNAKIRKTVGGTVPAHDHSDTSDMIPPVPLTAPPNVLKHDEPTLADKMNRRLLSYLKVVRTAIADSPGDGHKRTRNSKLIKVIDLTSNSETAATSATKMTYAQYLALDKTDSLSRSQSSSTSSLENVNKEAVQCLAFYDVYARKSDTFLSPCLWAGTNLGTVLVMSLSFSDDSESRKTEPVVVSPTGTIFRLKGAIVAISFLDSNGILIPSPGDQWRDSAKEKKSYCSKTDGQQSSSNLKPRISPVSSGDLSLDQQFAVLCSEKQARVVALPSQTCVFKVKVTETSTVVKAESVTFKDSACLACFLQNGHVMTFSLPSLKPLLDVDYIPFPDVRMIKTFCFSSNCHVLFFCSPSELQKLTLSAEMSESLSEMLSEMFIPCNMPEAPKQGFFKNLFNVGSASLDREELFGEGSGKAPKGVVKYTSMTQAQESAGAATSEIGRAKMLAIERGEKLGELEERTEKMKMDSELYMNSAQQLKNKYKDKKWYQL